MYAPTVPTLRVVSVFTGAAGLDLGLHRAGAQTVEMCESWEPARRVLASHFPDIDVHPDVARFTPGCEYDVLTAGFPCTDLSHAGGKAGIFGAQSGLVEHVFRIAAETQPAWIVLENVPNLLHLHNGLGIKTVTSRLEALGYRWAYRTLDSRFTGVPQRRNRVIVIASNVHDPGPVLLGQDSGLTDDDVNSEDDAYGFYWTEGRHGLGLIRGATPTLKGGSTIGLPSAPAVWVPNAEPGRKLLLPSLEAGERLQGFDSGWTDAAHVAGEHDPRWKLIGNAVTTGVGAWVGRRLALDTDETDTWESEPVDLRRTWPSAASGAPGQPPRKALVSKWPEVTPMTSLEALVDDAWTPLSYRATKGFLKRVDEAGRELPPAFSDDLEGHLQVMRPAVSTTAGGVTTRIEAAIREELDSRNVDYLLDVRPVAAIPHRVDIVVPASKTAVQIRTCFWHGCETHVDPHLAGTPRWVAKRDRVTARDADLVDQLTSAGWTLDIVWAHDDPRTAALHVANSVTGRRVHTVKVDVRRTTDATPALHAS